MLPVKRNRTNVHTERFTYTLDHWPMHSTCYFVSAKRMMMAFQWLNANSRCTWWSMCIIKNCVKYCSKPNAISTYALHQLATSAIGFAGFAGFFCLKIFVLVECFAYIHRYFPYIFGKFAQIHTENGAGILHTLNMWNRHRPTKRFYGRVTWSMHSYWTEWNGKRFIHPIIIPALSIWLEAGQL